VQAFGLDYRGIVDTRDLDWFKAMLEECNSLDVNDFWHDVTPYVTDHPLPTYRATAVFLPRVGATSSPPPMRYVETDKFELHSWTSQERFANTPEDPTRWQRT
jgi:hypothetical protein